MTLAHSTNHDAQAEIIAVVLPDGTPEQPDALQDFCATGTMLLVRHPDGRMALEPVRRGAGISRPANAPARRPQGRPILDPVSREVMGYEMDLTGTAHAC